MKITMLAGALLAAAGSSGAHSQVVRHPGPPTSPILAGVTIPAGSTLVILSGQVPTPLDPTAKPGDDPAAYGDTRTQATAVFHKIDTLLGQQGLGLKDVVKLTVFLVGDAKLGGKLDFKVFPPPMPSSSAPRLSRTRWRDRLSRCPPSPARPSCWKSKPSQRSEACRSGADLRRLVLPGRRAAIHMHPAHSLMIFAPPASGPLRF